MQRSRVYLWAALFFTVLSCEPEPPPTIPPPPPGPRLRPVAIAGEDKTVALSDAFRFHLYGGLSFDPAWPYIGSLGLSMNWKQLSGPELVDFWDYGEYAEFIAGSYGVYSFELAVRNDIGEAKDSITFTVVPGSCNPDLEYVKAEFREESVYTKAVPIDAGACVAAGRLILAGGDAGKPSNEIHIYDISAKSWKTAFLSVPRKNVSIGANRDYAFITGHASQSDGVDIYEFSTGKISTARLSQPRADGSVSVVGNKVVFAGGFDSKGNISEVMDIYDADSKIWSTAKFANARYKMVATVIGNKIYYSGGYTTDWDISNRVDVYEVSGGQWSTLKLNKGRVEHSAAVMNSTRLVFTGGQSWTSGGDLFFDESMEWLDVSTSNTKQECLFADYFTERPTDYAFGLASVFVGQNLYSCYNQFLTRFDAAGNKWKVSKGMKDHDLAGFFSDGNRLLAIATKKSDIENRDNISIYEVKF